MPNEAIETIDNSGDDFTGEYLDRRQKGNLTPYQELMQSIRPAVPSKNTSDEPFDPLPVFKKKEPGLMEKTKGAVFDIAKGVIEEGPTQVIGGITDAGREIGESLTGIADWMNLPTVLQITNEKGELDLDLLTSEQLHEQGGQFIAEAMKIKDPSTTTGGLARGVAQFLTGFIPATRALKGVGGASKAAKWGKAAAAGMAIDALAFDEHDERLSDLVEKFPALKNPVTEYLKSDPNDSMAEGKFKAAIEGLGLGIMTDALGHALKGIKAHRVRKLAEKAEKAEAERLAAETDKIDRLNFLAENPSSDAFLDMVREYPETKDALIDFLQSTNKNSLDRLRKLLEKKGIDPALIDPMVNAADSVKKEISKLTPEEKIDLEKTTMERLSKIEDVTDEFFPLGSEGKGKRRFKMGAKLAEDERALNINLDRVETTDDVKTLIEDVGVIFHDDINEARRQVVTNEQTIKLADDLGMSVKDLLKRRSGQAFTAEEALAARNILIASGKTLIDLSKKAVNGSDVDIFKFRRAMSQHHAIQLQVSGMTAEAGRALQSFNIIAKSAKEQEQMIMDALDGSGSRKVSNQLAKTISELDGITNVNVFVKQAAKATKRSMLYEAWINGLLSNPATHAVNFLGNGITTGMSLVERRVAQFVGAGLDTQSIPTGEVEAMMFGMVQGAKDGFKLAWQTLKSGNPSDPISKIEFAKRKAITAENLNLSGNAGRFADFMGEVFRSPGRFLMTSDELYKGINYRIELNAQAFRQARSEGLEGIQFSERVNQILNDPPDNIHIDALQFADRNRFMQQLGDEGTYIHRAIQRSPALKVLIPFYRTPVNIAKHVGERSILAPLSGNVRAEIAAGGARRDLALAKIAVGSTIMSIAADYALAGVITGGGPAHPEVRKRWQESGWQPYSIKVGDKYYAYNRLDPVGATIGIAADVALIMGNSNDSDALDIATASAISVAKNVMSKTYMRGMSDFFRAVSDMTADPEGRNTVMKRYIEKMGTTLVPFSSGVAGIERVLDPTLREVDKSSGLLTRMLQSIQARIPGLSSSLPPRRNLFGDPIVLEGGVGPDIMSPIYQSTMKKDAVVDEIIKQKTILRMPSNVVKGVELNAEMYDKYVLLYSGKDNYKVNMPLKEALKEMFDSSLYQEQTDGQEGGKSAMIKLTFLQYREAAKAVLIDNYEKLRNEIEKKQAEKAKKMGFDL